MTGHNFLQGGSNEGFAKTLNLFVAINSNTVHLWNLRTEWIGNSRIVVVSAHRHIMKLDLRFNVQWGYLNLMCPLGGAEITTEDFSPSKTCSLVFLCAYWWAWCHVELILTYTRPRVNSSKKRAAFTFCRRNPSKAWNTLHCIIHTSSKTMDMMVISGLSQGKRRCSCPHWPIR